MIDVWQADLMSPPRADADLRTLLSAEENAQADRYHFEADRSRFVRRRAFRRLWLSDRLGRPPQELRFTGGLRGKPALEEAARRFHFNASASGNRALLAFSESGEVGVDVESERSLDADLGLVIDRFSPGERDALKVLPPAIRTRMFFECWARKEAFVKAVGCGLFLPLEDFTVPMDPEVTAAPVRWDGDPVRGRRWAVTSLNVGSGARAAVAADQPLVVRLHRWSWPA